MRFAVAIGILAQTLAVSSEPTTQELLRKEMSAVPGSIKKLTKNGGYLNKMKSGIQSLQLSEPCLKNSTEISQSTDADTGILATGGNCPTGKYCNEYGKCVPELDMERNLQIGGGGFNYYDELCVNGGSNIADYLGVSADSISCNCDDVVAANQTGYIGCYVENPEVCDGQFCYDFYVGFSFEGDFSEYYYATECYDFYLPYQQEICYTTYPNSYDCDIYINQPGMEEVQCDVCLLLGQDPQGYPCTVFDCTNFAMGNAGNSCQNEFASDIFDFRSGQELPVEDTVNFLQMALFGVDSLDIFEQRQWAALTAQYIVNYYNTFPGTVSDVEAEIEVLAVIPGGARRALEGLDRSLQIQTDGFVTVVYNTILSYRVADPDSISPAEVAQLPFLTPEDQQNYVTFLQTVGIGDIADIDLIVPLGQREAIRPGGKGGKKGKKSKKSSKKSSKKGHGKGSYAYHPSMELYTDDHFGVEDDDYYYYLNNKKGSKSARSDRR